MKKYYFNTSAIVFITILSLIFIATAVSSVIYSRVMTLGDIILMLVPLFFLGFSLKYLIAAYRNIPALVINSEGIYDYRSGLTFLWKDIQSYKISKGSISYVSLDLHNPAPYITALKNPMVRLYKNAFKRYSFNLNLSLLTEQDERILDQIEYYDLEFQRSFLESL